METRVAKLYGQRDLKLESMAVQPPGEGEVLLHMAAAGICGSDLHYYQDGGFGPVRVREPIIPGHEASGFVAGLGPGVSGLVRGELVSVNPSQPCGHCLYCGKGQPIHCLDMRFMGSAMRLPHEQGMFRDFMVVPAIQCVSAGDLVSPGEAACAEPLAVCLHAVANAGEVAGKRALVTGSGPIGTLVVAALKHAGAAEIVATDLSDAALERAAAMGASRTINVGRDAALLVPFEADKGQFDVAFECSAAPAAIRVAMAAVKPRGTIVQVGVAGDVTVPLNMIVAKELRIHGTQRFHDEFEVAVGLIATRRIDVRPIISHEFGLDEATVAFEKASDRSAACKVQLTFSSGRPG